MLSYSEEVITALLAAPDVSAIITDQIYPEQPPSEAVFPCLVYSEANIPKGSADNLETLAQISFMFEAYQPGSAWPLAIAVVEVMNELGYRREYTQDAGYVGGVHQVSMKFNKEG